jgi:drug/metabolite transporter (DMT)-like permease
MFTSLAPIIFVLIWSTGLVVARAAVPHASVELFLTIRLVLSAALLAALAVFARESWPRGKQFAMHLVAGALLNGVYLSAAYWTVAHRMPAGIMSLIGSMQPVVIVIATFALFGERPSLQTVAGLGIAVVGVVAVLTPGLSDSANEHIGALSIVVALIAVMGMSAGTLIQRGKLAGDGVFVSASVQNAGGALVAFFCMLGSGTYQWDQAPALWASLAWSVLGLSVGAIILLVAMVRSHGATKMSTLLLAVPVLAAIEAWLLFGERLTMVQITGFVIALAGVVLARKRPSPQASQTFGSPKTSRPV